MHKARHIVLVTLVAFIIAARVNVSVGEWYAANLYPTTAEGTRYSEEFAVFLKGADGLDASYRPIVRALFHD